jgi:hypothetical protein
VVTGNRAAYSGGGVSNDRATVIVNALISGNTCRGTNTTVSQVAGGGVYTTSQRLILVNALISGNRAEVTVKQTDSLEEYNGGGGIKVNNAPLTLINCTVSGNYASYDTADGNTDLLPGGGLYAIRGGDIRAYNSLVLGNTGENVMDGGRRNDVATRNGAKFFAENSLVGGYTKADLDSGYSGASFFYPGTIIGTGSNNAEGADYGIGAATLLTNLQSFFTAFNALPTGLALGNTGADKAADWTAGVLWDFHLKSPPAGVVDGGSTTPYILSNAPTDVEGKPRVAGAAPDMGAYEKQ